MPTDYNNYTIVEYTTDLAPAVAKMWQDSKEGWLGEEMACSTESVRAELDNAGDLKSYLAINSQNVVLGYIGMTKMHWDSNAMYIELLNVLPELHGKKVGKALLVYCVQKAIEAKCNRLDLDTWSGNTKAVPLYKKCGFFWENDPQTIHLMNFLPNAFNHQLSKNWFDGIDWYKDRVINIEVAPDGTKHGDFEYFTYQWANAKHNLRLVYERKGRGLRLIETDDYLIEASLEVQEPAFGRSYPVAYNIVNKSGAPLTVEFTGQNNKYIDFDFTHKLNVTGQQHVKAMYKAKQCDDPIGPRMSWPQVACQIVINGQSATLGLGLHPQSPLNIELQTKKRANLCGDSGQLIVNVENFYSCPADFELHLPQVKGLELQNYVHNISLGPNAKGHIILPFTLHKALLLNHKAKVVASVEGETFEFEHLLSFAFTTYDSRLYGATPKQLIMNLANRHFEHNFLQEQVSSIGQWGGVVFFYPRLGKPFSDEFADQKPNRYQFDENFDEISLTMEWDSEDFESITLIVCFKLNSFGCLSRFVGLKNNGDCQPGTTMQIAQNIRLNTTGTIKPFDGISADEQHENDYWKPSRIKSMLTERWIWGQNDTHKIGLTWETDTAFEPGEWFWLATNTLTVPSPGQTVMAKPVKCYLSCFNDWRSMRALTTDTPAHHVLPHNHLWVEPANCNPFATGQHKLQLKSNYVSDQYRKIQLHNAQKLVLELNEDTPVGVMEESLHTNLLKLTTYTPSSISKSALALFNCSGSTKTTTSSQNGKSVITVDNAIAQITASPDFAPVLTGFNCMGQQWLDSSFPEFTSRGWWKPWAGGSYTSLNRINLGTLLEQNWQVEPCTRTDTLGNTWQGISASVEFANHKPLKGVKYTTCWLMLPGVPLLAQYTMLQDASGHAKAGWYVNNNTFVKCANNIADSRIWLPQTDGGQTIGIARDTSFNANTLQQAAFGSANSSLQMLRIHTDSHTYSGIGSNTECVNETFNAWVRLDGVEPPCTTVSYWLVGNNLNAIHPSAWHYLSKILFTN